jgi:hypothetical protein
LCWHCSLKSLLWDCNFKSLLSHQYLWLHCSSKCLLLHRNFKSFLWHQTNFKCLLRPFNFNRKNFKTLLRITVSKFFYCRVAGSCLSCKMPFLDD